MDFTLFTKWTVRLLYLQIVISVVGLVCGVIEGRVLNGLNDGTFATEAEAIAAAEASDALSLDVGVLQCLVFLVSGIWILRWIYRASCNARELGAAGMRFSEGGSVFWYFVPILNLWKPFQAMKEIWRASERPRDWQNGPAHGLLVAWWTLWLLSSSASNASLRLTLRAESMGELLAANHVTLISDLLNIPLSIVFSLVVKTIHDMQTAPRPEVAVTKTGAPAVDAA